MTWWLRDRDPDEAKFLSVGFSPLTSAKACEKSSRRLWKEIRVCTGVRKPGNTCMCVTDRHDMTLAVKVALNLNTTNQQDLLVKVKIMQWNKKIQHTIK